MAAGGSGVSPTYECWRPEPSGDVYRYENGQLIRLTSSSFLEKKAATAVFLNVFRVLCYSLLTSQVGVRSLI